MPVVDIRDGRFVLREKVPTFSLDALQDITGARLHIDARWPISSRPSCERGCHDRSLYLRLYPHPHRRFGGALSSVRADDLGAIPLKALIARNPGLDWEKVDDAIFGCANQAGEDNRNVARMSLLLAGLPLSIGGTTINRLCGSGMDAVATAARAIKAGEADLIIAGGVESMSRAPFVMPKADAAFSRRAEIYDTTIGWRFVNPVMKEMYGVDSMPETGDNVAIDHKVSREDQDAFAVRSQEKAAAARRPTAASPARSRP